MCLVSSWYYQRQYFQRVTWTFTRSAWTAFPTYVDVIIPSEGNFQQIEKWHNRCTRYCDYHVDYHVDCYVESQFWLPILTICWLPMLATMLSYQSWLPILTSNFDNQCWLAILTTNADYQCWQPMLTTDIDYHRKIQMLTTYGIVEAIWSNIMQWLTKI